MDGPRPRHYRDPVHGGGFGPPPPVHNSYDSVGGRNRPMGTMMNRVNDFVQQPSSACDGMLSRSLSVFVCL